MRTGSQEPPKMAKEILLHLSNLKGGQMPALLILKEDYMKNENTRKEKYHLLRNAGFNSFEANKLKEYSWEKVHYFIVMQEKFERYKMKMIQEKGRKHGNQS